jgi:tRNA (guanine-N7-)-methyltransferase
MSLVYPYCYQDRAPIFVDGVLFIPEFFNQLDQSKHAQFGSLEWTASFNHPQIALEICSGNGQWLIEQAQKRAHVLWIACELRYDRVKKIYKAIKKRCLTNVVIVLGSGELLAEYYLPQSSISEVYINFPDPWPKRKHAKNRLIQTPFISHLKKALKPQGIVSLATDDLDYMQQSVAVFKESKLKPLYEEPYYQPLAPDYGSSFFENLWSKKGKINRQTQFICS